MPGLARTTQFSFSTATVMVAPMATAGGIDAIDNSIGLTKNLQFTVDTSSVELTQGIQNQVVATINNKQSVKCSVEVYELTARNLAYGLGLDATNPADYTPSTIYAPLVSAVAGAATTFEMAGDVHTSFPVGGWCFLQQGLDDLIHIAQVVTAVFTTPNTVITINTPVPASMAFDTINGRAGAINKVDASPSLPTSLFTVRILGVTAMDQRPIGVHMPKVHITRGYSMSFSDSKWDALPFEFEPLVPVVGDPGFSANFSSLFSTFVP